MSSDGDKASLEAKIKNIDQQMAVLQKLKAQCLQKLNFIEQTPITVIPKPFTATHSDDKVTIFCGYFHGREDVYAKLWVNNRTGKRGYSPACRNEWVRSLCRKPAVKCSECPNQQFLLFDEAAIHQHLEGRQVIGVYPMLKNEACHFIPLAQKSPGFNPGMNGGKLRGGRLNKQIAEYALCTGEALASPENRRSRGL